MDSYFQATNPMPMDSTNARSKTVPIQLRRFMRTTLQGTCTKNHVEILSCHMSV